MIDTIPHCDARILHAPGECEYCDRRPELQEARRWWGIAYTGHDPEPDQRPCPADEARPAGGPNDHRRWGGNRPTTSYDDPNWPEETVDSKVLYGEPEYREPGLMIRLGRSLRETVRGLG